MGEAGRLGAVFENPIPILDEGFEPAILRRAPGLRPGGATSCPNTPTFGGEGASRTRKSQRYVPFQTGSACQMPNLSNSHDTNQRISAGWHERSVG